MGITALFKTAILLTAIFLGRWIKDPTAEIKKKNSGTNGITGSP